VITLTELKARGGRLKGMLLLKPGSRLSVTPVEKAHWDFILALE
jgi:predicted RNA-binding protein with PUA-like domain